MRLWRVYRYVPLLRQRLTPRFYWYRVGFTCFVGCLVSYAASSNPHAGARTGQASRFEHDEASTGCMQQYRTKQGGKKLAESLSLGCGKQAKMNAIHGVCCNPAFRKIVIRDTLPGHAACSSQIAALLALRSLPLK